MKPVVNLDSLEFESFERGSFQQRYASISSLIGAQLLGYNLTIIPPGKKGSPFHSHRANEEMFFILEGEGLLRFGDEEYSLRKYDVVACPPGGPSIAHEITNTGTTDLKYLALSTLVKQDICEYPDSDEIGVFSGDEDRRDLRMFFKRTQATRNWGSDI